MRQQIYRAYFREVSSGEYEFSGRYKNSFSVKYFDSDLSNIETSWLQQFLAFVVDKVAFGCRETTKRYEYLMYQIIDELKRRGAYNGVC